MKYIDVYLDDRDPFGWLSGVQTPVNMPESSVLLLVETFHDPLTKYLCTIK